MTVEVYPEPPPRVRLVFILRTFMPGRLIRDIMNRRVVNVRDAASRSHVARRRATVWMDVRGRDHIRTDPADAGAACVAWYRTSCGRGSPCGTAALVAITWFVLLWLPVSVSAEPIAAVALPDIGPVPVIGVASPSVRVAYLIPSNRTPQPGAATNLANLVRLWHAVVCEQMDRNGFGHKSFRYETEGDGVTPVIHVVQLAETDAYLRGDIWARVNQAAGDAGVPVWTPGEVWVLFPEIHVETPDGAILGGVALGASFGSGDDPGVAMVSSDRLSIDTLAGLTDDTAYAGVVVPPIGPYPLVQDVSFPWFEGSTFSSVVSSIEGATVHEAGHAFGLGHDFRNDGNFHGNIMANGLRGFRGTVFPPLYAGDDGRVSYAAALALSVSRYFTACDSGGTGSMDGGGGCFSDPRPGRAAPPGAVPHQLTRGAHPAYRRDAAEAPVARVRDAPGIDDVVRPFPTGAFTPDAVDAGVAVGGGSVPSVGILTSGAVAPVGGLLEIEFQAESTIGLAAALLRRNGDTIGEMSLDGTAVSTAFATPYYAVDEADAFAISVYDTHGSRTDATTTITPVPTANRAPVPFFSVVPSRVRVDEAVLLDQDALGTTDPDDAAASVTVEWDWDGDGVFDTAPTTSKTLVTSFADVGPRLVRVRVTDPAGAQFVSTPIALRVVPDEPGDIDRDGGVGLLDFFVFGVCMTGPGGAVGGGCEDADLDGD
ncbi:MAG: hypothetical protein ACE5E6_06375, partial [Phycisphaerae bacterium]